MELWDLGIRAAGTRIAATKRMAWHLLFVKRLAIEDVAGQLVQWVYATGATTSADVTLCANDRGDTCLVPIRVEGQEAGRWRTRR
jgi:hypothetical protein